MRITFRAHLAALAFGEAFLDDAQVCSIPSLVQRAVKGSCESLQGFAFQLPDELQSPRAIQAV